MVRTSTITKLVGGVSALTKEVVKLFDSFGTGLLLTFKSGNRKFLFGTMSVLVADEGALKAIWAVKGASGSLPCLFCWNVVQQRSELHLEDDRLVPHTTTDLCKIKTRTDTDFVEAARLLTREKAIRNKKQFELLEQSIGLNYVPTGILFDRTSMLKPIAHTMYDWLHVYLVNGIFQTEANLMLDVLNKAGCNHTAVTTFLKDFRGPKDQSSNLKAAVQAFDKAKNKDAWKPSASEALGVYPLLRLLVLEHGFEDDLHKVCAKSFLTLCGILDMLSQGNKGEVIDPAVLQRKILTHLSLYKSSYTAEDLQPKFHYSLHLPALLRKHSRLISCWTHERKHKQLKMWANQVANAGEWYERSVLKEVTQTCFSTLESFQPSSVHLCSPKEATPQVLRRFAMGFIQPGANLMVAKSVNVFGMTCHIGDVVVLNNEGTHQVGQIYAHIEVAGGNPWTLVAIWDSMGKNRFRVNVTSGQWFSASCPDCCFKV